MSGSPDPHAWQQSRPAQAALWAVVLAGPLALFGPMLLRGHALFWGAPFLQFTPWRTATLEILRNGHLPLWNPWLGMGAPLLANYQSGLLYPPNLLLLLTDIAWGQTLLVMLHLAWAGAGMLFLARRLGLGMLGQGVASVSFALGGYLVARSSFLSMNATAAWLPWILVAVDDLADAEALPRWRRTAGVPILAIVLSLQWLAGHAQLAWYSAVLAGCWGLWRGWRFQRWTGALRSGGRLLAAAGLAFALAAAQLIPTLQYLSQSGRATGLEPGFALTYSFWPWRMLGLLAPDLFGNPAQGNYWGYANYWEDAIYIGVLPVLLAVLGVFALGTSRPRMRWFLVAAAIIAFLLALGDYTPLFPFLFRTLPTFDMFQAPTRWTLLTVLALSLLAGLGANHWRAPSPRATYWLRLGTVGACTMIAAAWLGPRLIPGLEPTLAPAVSRAGLLLAASGGLALLRPQSHAMSWDVAALGLVVLDLLTSGYRLNPSQPLALQGTDPGAVAQLADGHRLYMSPELEQDLKFDRHFRFNSYQPGHDWEQVRAAGLPNTTLLAGLPSANNFDPLLPGRYTAFLVALSYATPERRALIFDLMDVGWEAVEDSNTSAGVHYDQRTSAHRARWVPTAEWVAGPEQALRRLLDPAFDPTAAVLLEGTPSAQPAVAGGSGTVQVIPGADPNIVDLQVQAQGGGWAVLHDTWYPGWQAFVDGEESPMYAADGLFRAVRVPDGTHSLSFRYDGRVFWTPAAISALAWVAVLAWLFRLRRARSNAHP